MSAVESCFGSSGLVLLIVHLQTQQCPGETSHTTSVSLRLSPFEFSVVRYNVGGKGKS